MTTPGSYNTERTFLRIVELGSIRAAAREAGMEPSSLSRKLARLEVRLGTQLIDRAAQGTTEAGALYYNKMRALLSQIDALEAAVAGDAGTPRGTLRLGASIDFGQAFVAPWLTQFCQLHDQVQGQLTLDARQVDMVEAGLDLTIRIGTMPDSALMARKLGTAHRVLVAAPAYLARRGTPVMASDLETHDHILFLPEHANRPLRLTDADGKEHSIPRRARMTIGAVRSIADAVAAGMGVHAGPRWAFAEMLRTGQVVEVLPDHTQPALPICAVWPPVAIQPARVRAFVDFAANEIKKVPALSD
ncbi:LysR family transcriptional regulator [uncultured Tateyamaria sp.]|uniref:LysR family transcriptional regulator n=1 Tax=uncultured Tateyamaria sp. TaxID=455651 RepID=UPI002619B154|nr:LysR family transcriptional regulator [uncultured Tateyamaria sp.]